MLQSHHPKQCILVDPGDASPALRFLDRHQLTLCAVLVTHCHWDHVDGIAEIIRVMSARHTVVPPVFGPYNETIPCLTHPVRGGQCFSVPNGSHYPIHVFAVPGHTRGHVAYYIKGVGLFSGDTLFAAGCGRAFEGTHAQLYQSLCCLAQLPAKTPLYCGHEYTQNNLQFAATLFPQDTAIAARLDRVRQQRQQGQPSLPTLLQEEFNTNLFLRSHVPSVRRGCEALSGSVLATPEAVFSFLRDQKDRY